MQRWLFDANIVYGGGGLYHTTAAVVSTMWPAGQQNAVNCSGHFQGAPCGSLGPQETTKKCYTRKNTQQSLKKEIVSVRHPVGVGAPGTGVAPKVAPTRPLGFPTGT